MNKTTQHYIIPFKSMSKRFAALAIIAAGFASATAMNIKDLQPGRLSEAGIPNDETELIISGELNAADFAYIFDNLSKLARLDLSAANIAAYSGSALPYTGISTSASDKLPDYALTGMTSLTSIELPATLTAIGKGALSGTGLTSLTVTPAVEVIGDYAAMRCEKLGSIMIPKSVTSIGTRAFAYCPALQTVKIEASVPALPEGLFEACGGLRTLSLESLASCTDIGPWSVAECNGLTTLLLPANSRAIEAGAAYGASGIETLILPESVEYIGSNAMSAMNSLRQLNVSQVTAVPELGENVWSRIDPKGVTLITPNEQVDDYRNADQWKDFNVVSVDSWQSSTQNIASTVGSDTFIVTTDKDNIDVKCSGNSKLGNIAVFNTAGTRIFSSTAKTDIRISTSGWPTGVYLIVTDLGAAKISI